MSKTKTKTPRPSTGGKPTGARPWINKRSTMVSLGLLIFGMAAICTLHLHASAAAAGSFAALYLFANDGKVSGRMSGDVKMRNGRQRAWAYPSLVRNAYTTAIRASFAALSTGFRGLSPAEINQWNAFQYKHSNRFAQEINVTGKMAYIGVNQNLTDIGQPNITSPVAFVGVTEQILSTPIVFASAGTMTVTATAYDAADKYLVYATKSLSAGVRKPRPSDFRIVSLSPTITGGVMDFSADYTTKYGNPIAGMQVFVYTVPVDKTTGEKGVGSNIIGGLVS